MSTPNAAASALPSPNAALYRRAWRWHFYAGLICLPVIVLLAVTGGLYLFRVEIESVLYRHELENAARGPATIAASEAIGRAAATGGVPLAYSPPAAPGESAMVLVRRGDGERRQVFVDSASGAVLGSIAERWRLMPLLRSLHSLAFFGKGASYLVEIVAGWVIVLVATGVVLWWPRGRTERLGGVATLRQAPPQRLWWRDLHAVTGAFAAVVILFLAVTGMPWSAFWGERFTRAMTEAGLGVPAAAWVEVPQSEAPLASLGSVPWPVHQHHMPMSAPPPAAAPAGDIGVDRAVAVLAGLGLHGGYELDLPDGPRGVYSAIYQPDHVREQRIVHLDRYSGRVLADVGYSRYGPVGKLTSWGVSIHMGREFGLLNQLVLLAGCLALLVISASAVVIWWKRRPRGALAAPARRDGDRIGRNVAAVAIALGVVFPLLGLSMLIALAVDLLVPAIWRAHWAL